MSFIVEILATAGLTVLIAMLFAAILAEFFI
jgi:hypothetical protein